MSKREGEKNEDRVRRGRLIHLSTKERKNDPSLVVRRGRGMLWEKEGEKSKWEGRCATPATTSVGP